MAASPVLRSGGSVISVFKFQIVTKHKLELECWSGGRDPLMTPSMFEDVEEQEPRGEHGKDTPHRKYGVPQGPLACLAPRRTPATWCYQF